MHTAYLEFFYWLKTHKKQKIYTSNKRSVFYKAHINNISTPESQSLRYTDVMQFAKILRILISLRNIKTFYARKYFLSYRVKFCYRAHWTVTFIHNALTRIKASSKVLNELTANIRTNEQMNKQPFTIILY